MEDKGFCSHVCPPTFKSIYEIGGYARKCGKENGTLRVMLLHCVLYGPQLNGLLAGPEQLPPSHYCLYDVMELLL